MSICEPLTHACWFFMLRCGWLTGVLSPEVLSSKRDENGTVFMDVSVCA
jgi:hypothetical protein